MHGGAEYEGNDQPAPNLLHELNRVKRVCVVQDLKGMTSLHQAFYMS